MSSPAFDAHGAARTVKAAGMVSEHAEAIVEVMGRFVNQLVTVERFDAGLGMLQARVDTVQTELQTRIDFLRTEMRADIVCSQLILVGVVTAANALMMTILGILLTQGALM